MPTWKITDIDYFECDAILEYNGERHYFQFGGAKTGPSFGQALKYLFLEGHVSISKEKSV
jgi:hypothetical protein